MASLYLVNLAEAALNSGVAVSSASTPALDAVYPVDPGTWQKYMAVAVYLLINGRFPAGQPTWTVTDMNGLPRTFPNVASFRAFLTAVADYAAQLQQIIDGVSQRTSLPSQQASIP